MRRDSHGRAAFVKRHEVTYPPGMAESKSGKVVVCPYCGKVQPASAACVACNGEFSPLSRQATQNEMGPWYIRDESRPFRPGVAYERLLAMIDESRITRYTVLRGPTTGQLWTVAKRVPCVAHHLGDCHACHAKIKPHLTSCSACGVRFGAWLDRNHLGLPDIRPLPWDPDGVED